MAKEFPYFRFYPADAEADARYAAMNMTERGLFHHAMNYAWVNDGLPADDYEVGRVLRASVREFRAAWPRVKECFQLIDGKLRNPRQEAERQHAKAKSEKSTSAVRSRYGRNTDVGTNVLPRAYDTDSVSEKPEQQKDLAKASLGDFQFLESVWEQWKRQRRGQARDLVFQMILAADNFDWPKFRHRAPLMVKHCEAMNPPWQFASLSLWDWIEGGMILPPDAESARPVKVQPYVDTLKLEMQQMGDCE